MKTNRDIGRRYFEQFTPDSFATAIIAAHVRREMKVKLVAIEEKYRSTAEAVS